VRNRERERRNRRVELAAVLGNHLVAAAHRADRRGQARARRVLEALARREPRLLADDTGAPDFLHAVLAVGDDPVPRHEPRGDRADIGDPDRVAEHELVARRVRLLGDVGRHRLDPDLVLRFVRHPHHPVR